MTQDIGDQLHRQIDDIERQMDEANTRLDKARTIQNLVEDVVGSADAADGYVHVEYRASGLDVLDINPRAMKLASADLAAEIKQALTDAVADFRTKTVEALEAAGAMPSPEGLERDRVVAREEFQRAQQQFSTSLRGAADEIGRVTRQRRDAGI